MHARLSTSVKHLPSTKVARGLGVARDRLIEVGTMAVRALAVTVVLITATDLIMAAVQVMETARAIVVARARAMAQEITVVRVLIH